MKFEQAYWTYFSNPVLFGQFDLVSKYMPHNRVYNPFCLKRITLRVPPMEHEGNGQMYDNFGVAADDVTGRRSACRGQSSNLLALDVDTGG